MKIQENPATLETSICQERQQMFQKRSVVIATAQQFFVIFSQIMNFWTKVKLKVTVSTFMLERFNVRAQNVVWRLTLMKCRTSSIIKVIAHEQSSSGGQKCDFQGFTWKKFPCKIIIMIMANDVTHMMSQNEFWRKRTNGMHSARGA